MSQPKEHPKVRQTGARVETREFKGDGEMRDGERSSNEWMIWTEIPERALQQPRAGLPPALTP